VGGKMYHLFYGFHTRPFQSSLEDKLHYLSPMHKQALVRVSNGILRAKGWILLTGLQGCGKSLMLRRLVKECNTSDTVIARLQGPYIPNDSVLPLALDSFDSHVIDQDPKTLVYQFKKFLLHKVDEGKRCILMVDDAECLSLDNLSLLRLFSSIRYKGVAPLTILLVGENALQKKLLYGKHAALKNEIFMVCTLYPLNKKDVKKYIVYQLVKSGWKGDPVIEDDVYDRVFDLTSGIPGYINSVIEQALMTIMEKDQHILTVNELPSINKDLVEVIHHSKELVETKVIQRRKSQRLNRDANAKHELRRRKQKFKFLPKVAGNISLPQRHKTRLKVVMVSYLVSFVLAIGVFYLFRSINTNVYTDVSAQNKELMFRKDMRFTRRFDEE